MTVLAVHNLKGGVGKTSTAVNLAWLAALEGRRTLLWDLDPQGAATHMLRVVPKVAGGAKAVARGGDALSTAIRGTEQENLDVLPADPRHRNLDVVLDGKRRPRKRLREAVAPLAKVYDLVVLDTAPGLGLAIENVLRAADLVLVPVVPSVLSLRSLEQVEAFVKAEGLDEVRLLPFATMVDRRRRLHGEIRQQLAAEHPEALATAIPYASEVERMGVERRPLGAFAAASPAGRAYEALWAEVRERLG